MKRQWVLADDGGEGGRAPTTHRTHAVDKLVRMGEKLLDVSFRVDRSSRALGISPLKKVEVVHEHLLDLSLVAAQPGLGQRVSLSDSRAGATVTQGKSTWEDQRALTCTKGVRRRSTGTPGRPLRGPAAPSPCASGLPPPCNVYMVVIPTGGHGLQDTQVASAEATHQPAVLHLWK